MTIQGETKLHDQLTEAYERTVDPGPSTTEPASTSTEATEPAKDTAAPASTGERARDPKTGQFLPGSESKKDAAPRADPAKDAKPAAAPAVPAQSVEERLGLKRPDSWKKELWPLWEKLDAGQPLTKEERKQYLEYINEREGQFVKGVSAYKAEAEHARGLIQAISPYQQMMQQQGLSPEKFITALANTHQVLSGGNPQDKLRAFARFAQDYQIPLHELFVQGEDGKVYFNQQYFQPKEPESQGALTRSDVDRLVNEKMRQMMLGRLVEEFKAAKDGGGNPLHPHFDEVRTTMDGLLRSGVVKDLQSAYDMALKAPQHAATYSAIQEQNRKAEAEAKAKEEADRVARAKAAAAQTKTDTPTGTVGAGGKKGLRATIEESYDRHVTGRI